MRSSTEKTIQRASTRRAIAPRREPYWRQLAPGRYIGFRKMESGSQTWIAKYKRKFKSLGAVSDSTYSQAVQLANQWFKSCDAGITDSPTVADACKAYVENIRRLRGDQRAADPDGRFKVLVYDTKFGNTKLDKITAPEIETWRDKLVTDKRGKVTVNRIFVMLKAALNYAYKRRMVMSDHAWRVVGPLPCVPGKRERILSIEERSVLLAQCAPYLRVYLQGLLSIAARPGELDKATVGDLDLKTRTLSLTTHKGRNGIARQRTIPLSDAAYALFKGQAKGKLPKALLFPMDETGREWHKVYRSRQLKSAIVDAELSPGIVTYTMRHTTISEWLAAGIDIATVAKIAGTSIAMIDKYYHKFIKTDVADKLSAIRVY